MTLEKLVGYFRKTQKVRENDADSRNKLCLCNIGNDLECANDALFSVMVPNVWTVDCA